MRLLTWFQCWRVRRLRASGDIAGLLKTLDRQKDPEVRLAAIHALGDLGDHRTVASLLSLVRAGDHGEREAATDALERILATPGQKPTPCLGDAESVREGYKAAIALWTYQGTLNWNRFNVMLTANSILIAALGVVSASQYPLPVVTVGGISLPLLPLLGLCLCALWFLLTIRGYEWHRYWGRSARELEEMYLSSLVGLVSRSQPFNAGREIAFRTQDGPETLRMRLWSRIAGSQRRVTYAVILVFAVLYGLIWWA